MGSKGLFFAFRDRKPHSKQFVSMAIAEKWLMGKSNILLNWIIKVGKQLGHVQEQFLAMLTREQKTGSRNRH